MNKSQIMNPNLVNELHCVFCDKTFKRESAFVKHTCVKKSRFLNKDTVESRIAFDLWVEFHYKERLNRDTSFMSFISSSFYTAFVKFAAYCIEIKALYPKLFMYWLLDNKVKIDFWCSDTQYDKYLFEFTRTEQPLDAVARTIEYITKVASTVPEYFTSMGTNKICHEIRAGRISPWFLLLSSTGQRFLSSLDENQSMQLASSLDPEFWAVMLKRKKEATTEIREIFQQCGM